MNLGIQEKIALVTGGSNGIGFSIAKSLVQAQAKVIIASRSQQNVEKAISTLKEVSPQATVEGCTLDTSNEASITQAVDRILSEKGKIDILINNTGGPAAGNALDIELSGWDHAYHLLLRSVLLLAQKVIPAMREQKWGRILNVTSTASKELIARLPVSATFRAGLRAWTKSVAKDVGKDNVLLNNLLPGPTGTDRLSELKVKSPDFYRSFQSEMGIGRIPSPDELGPVATFLCSQANTIITGTDIVADGGFTKSL